ncbi:MAG TPA: histidinol-phosphate transaminase [Legionella sp.]|nr:histidinol-phosphate transaminase [Legionella sp.]
MPCDYDALPHAGIRTLIPYIPGKSADALSHEKSLTNIIKLASNENPLGCSPLVIEALSHLTGHKIATYPMSINHPLREKLAVKLGVDAPMVTLGNGSDSLFCLLLTCFALHTGRHVITHDYAFSSYAIQAKTLGIPVVSTVVYGNWAVDIDAMIAACDDKTALVFIANPNNPTGLRVNDSDIERLLKAIPVSTILVLDEAYCEFDHNHRQAFSISLLSTYPNLVITRTFSKAYGLASLRLGYAIAHPQITALLYRIQLPFVVNIAAMIAADAALDDDDFIAQTIEMTGHGLKQMQAGLNTLGLTHNNPTMATNFITMDCGTDSMPVYNALQEHGIIVRPLHPYGLKHYLRVTIGTEEQNNRFLDALSITLKRGSR